MSQKGKGVELARLLHDRIMNKVLAEGQQLEAIPKLAVRYKTTVATVSKAFDILERQGYIERHPGRGCYVKAKPARTFAVIFDTASDRDGDFNYKPIFLKAFHRLAAAAGYRYDVFNNIDSAVDCARIKPQIQEGGYDAVLIASRYVAEHVRMGLGDSLALPIGLYSYKWLDTTVSITIIQLIEAGGRELLARGCDHVALLLDQRNLRSWSSDQNDPHLSGYREMLRQGGVLFDAGLVKHCTLDPRSGYEATVELLETFKGDRLGIIGLDSLLTVGVLQAVAQSDRKLNEDVWVASHVNPACPLAKFPVPVLCYEAPIDPQIERIFELIDLRLTKNQVITGHHELSLCRIE